MPSSTLSRRTLLGGVAATPLLGLLAACSGTAGSSPSSSAALTSALNIYTWPDYFSTADLKAYTAKYGVTPRITTYTDNNTLFTKLNSANGAGYDIVVPSSSWIKQIADHGLLEELDHDRLPNLSGLDQSLLNRNYDKGNRYSVPKDYGLLGLVYDPAVVGTITTWQDFFDAGAKSGVSGRIRMTSAAEETVGPALWVAGKDWNTTDIADIQGTEDFLTSFAKHVKTFAGFDPQALASGAIVLAQCNQAAARNAIKLNPKLKWVVPGPTSELWVDSFAIAKGAPDLGRAYQFLNYQLSPTVQINETVYLGYPASLAGLKDKLPSNVTDADLIFGGTGVDFDALTSFVVNPTTFPAFQDIQTKVQAAAGA